MKAFLITEDRRPMAWEENSYPEEIILGEAHQAEQRLAELQKLRPKSFFMLHEEIDVLDLRKQNK